MKLNNLEFILMNNPIRAIIQEQYEIKAFLDVESRVKDKEVLEIGCGNGHGATLIDKYFHPGKVYGIDIDERMIDKAKTNISSKYSFKVGDATQLDFKDDSLDGIFDFGIIHHIPNWEKCIDELYRVLRKGGQVFLEELSIESFQSPIGLFLKSILDHPYNSMFTQSQFHSYLEKVGFKLIKKEVRRPFGLISYFVVVGVK